MVAKTRASDLFKITPEKLMREMFERLSPACKHRSVRKDYLRPDYVVRDVCKKLSVDNDLCTIENCPLLRTRVERSG